MNNEIKHAIERSRSHDEIVPVEAGDLAETWEGDLRALSDGEVVVDGVHEFWSDLEDADQNWRVHVRLAVVDDHAVDALRREAWEAGDRVLHARCIEAIEGDGDARRVCGDAIDNARRVAGDS